MSPNESRERELLYRLQCQNEKLEVALRERDEAIAEAETVRESRNRWRLLACELSDALRDTLGIIDRSQGFMFATDQELLRNARRVHGGK